MTIREDPLQRLASLVTQARLATIVSKKPMSKPKATTAIGFGSRDTLDRVEGGLRALPVTYAMIEQFFGWEAGSIIDYLDHNGVEPHKAVPVGPPEEKQTVAPGYADLTSEQQRMVDAVIRAIQESGTGHSQVT